VHNILGHKIVEVRAMSQQEALDEEWYNISEYRPVVTMLLDNGTRIFANLDSEDNPTKLFAIVPDGRQIILNAPEERRR